MRFWLMLVLLFAVSTSVPAGGDPNACDEPGDEPDVIVGSLYQLDKKGSSGGITAFSVGTISCNVGSCWLNWFSGGDSNQHPVIGQNMFRLKDGRFEQVGQAWLKHGFTALAGDECSNDCIQPPNGNHLGVNCSDPYSSFLNGKQIGMGPKFEVNPSSGAHPHPPTDISQTGNSIYKRLQVHDADLDPALNTGALYWVEGQYVAEDDAGFGNQNNNASYRPIDVSGSNGNFDASLTGSTKQGAAIRAWRATEPSVEDFNVDVPGDGRFILAAKTTDLGGGVWHYEYAIHNLSSHRSAMSFSVPVPLTGVTNIGFHDVDYHSGEPFDNVDWTHNSGAGGVLTWTTGENENDNPNANALRWGTLYNFRFDAGVPPDVGDVTLGLYRSGTPDSMTLGVPAPLLCDSDGFCDPGEDCERCAEDCADGTCDPGETGCTCSADCGAPPASEIDCGDLADDDCDGLVDCQDPDCCLSCSPADGDSDGVVECFDCNDADGQVWNTPGEVQNLIIGPGSEELSWNAPVDPGSMSVTYEVLRARDPDDFVGATTCLVPTIPTSTMMVDTAIPLPGQMLLYLPRALNTCPAGVGTLGAGSDALPRAGRSCP